MVVSDWHKGEVVAMVGGRSPLRRFQPCAWMPVAR